MLLSSRVQLFVVELSKNCVKFVDLKLNRLNFPVCFGCYLVEVLVNEALVGRSPIYCAMGLLQSQWLLCLKVLNVLNKLLLTKRSLFN